MNESELSQCPEKARQLVSLKHACCTKSVIIVYPLASRSLKAVWGRSCTPAAIFHNHPVVCSDGDKACCL